MSLAWRTAVLVHSGVKDVGTVRAGEDRLKVEADGIADLGARHQPSVPARGEDCGEVDFLVIAVREAAGREQNPAQAFSSEAMPGIAGDGLSGTGSGILGLAVPTMAGVVSPEIELELCQVDAV
jgi:hypothetical protein